ncbi:ImuA family protein [Maritimibacter fusiformis]|uniref:ImuA family protein n=1 Tax=Maritimibacter fusiformis TaxID=2603819 RepID=UPI002482D7D9|nr:hypothetical protein [Maritimibacter fusiformis]
MQQVRLSRAPHRPARSQPFLDGLGLAPARVHEAHGPARHMFAMLVARATAGPVFWIAPGWQADRLYAPGMVRLGVDPGRVTFVTAHHARDLLWTLEEVLRAGVVPLTIADLPGPPALTPMRRLNLAAEAGAEAAGQAPLGLILTPEGAAPGAESRWRMAPAHGAAPDDAGPEAEQTAWVLARERARDAPPRRWRVRPAGADFALAPDLAGSDPDP